MTQNPTESLRFTNSLKVSLGVIRNQGMLLRVMYSILGVPSIYREVMLHVSSIFVFWMFRAYSCIRHIVPLPKCRFL